MGPLDELFENRLYDNEVTITDLHNNVGGENRNSSSVGFSGNLGFTEDEWTQIKQYYQGICFTIRSRSFSPTQYSPDTSSRPGSGNLPSPAKGIIGKELYSKEVADGGYTTAQFNISCNKIRQSVLRRHGTGYPHSNSEQKWQYLLNYKRAEDYPSRIVASIKIGNYYFSNTSVGDNSVMGNGMQDSFPQYGGHGIFNKDDCTFALDLNIQYNTSRAGYKGYFDACSNKFLEEDSDGNGYSDIIFTATFIPKLEYKMYRKYEMYSKIYRLTANCKTQTKTWSLSPLN